MHVANTTWIIFFDTHQNKRKSTIIHVHSERSTTTHSDPTKIHKVPQQPTKITKNPQRLRTIKDYPQWHKKNIGKQCQNTESIQYHIIIDNNSQPSTMTLKRLQCSATTK